MKRRTLSSFVSFDVTYTDGTRSSNRKIPSSVLEGIEKDAAVEAAIAAQDRRSPLHPVVPRVLSNR